MKIVLFLIIFCTIALPALADLTPEDLDKIRSLLKEEIDPIKEEIKELDTRLQNVEQGISWMRGKLEGVDKQISHATNVTYGLIALIVLAVGIPQIIIAWRGKKGSRTGETH